MTEKLSYQQALKIASGLCGRSEKCKADISADFRSWGLSEDEISNGIEFLTREKFIDEQRYSKHFVHDKFRLNKWGKIKIAYMLRMKRIPEEIIREALNEIEEEEYRMVVRNLLQNKIKSVKGASGRERKAKLAVFALGRGFEGELAYSIAEEVISGEK